MTAQIIIIGLAFLYGMASGGYLVYFLYNDEKTQQSKSHFKIHSNFEKILNQDSHTKPIVDFLEELKNYEYENKSKESYLEKETERYNKQLRDMKEVKDFPKPFKYESPIIETDEKEILDRFDIDIAKTCETVDKLEKTYKELIQEFSIVLKDINETVNKKIKEGRLPKNSLFSIQTHNCQYPITIDVAFEISGIKDCHEPNFDFLEEIFPSPVFENVIKRLDTPEKQFEFLKNVGYNKSHKPFPLDKNGNGGC